MLRFLFSAGAVFVLFLSMCLLPQTASARRCGYKEPETLLSLYQNSDAIYVATFDKVVEGEVIEKNDNFTTVEIRKHFTISSTLKGQSRKFFELQNQENRYEKVVIQGEPEAEVEEPGSEKPESEVANEEETSFEDIEEEEESDLFELKNGDTLLLFIKNGEEEGESPTLTDYRDGIKKLSTEKIGVYEARINELNSIFSAKKISEARILEWLIRCAENPITRWEGTFELLRSVRNQKWRDEAEQRRKERIDSGLPVEEIAVVDENEEPSKDGKHVNTDVFAKMLDGSHKQTLANILLNFRSGGQAEKSGGKPEYINGDRELIQLVSQWGDPRLMSFLIDQIRADSDDPSDTAEKMGIVAEILKSDAVSEIAGKYAENAYESDDDEVESESAEDEADVPEVEPAPETIPAEEPAEKPEKEEPETSDKDEAVEKPEAKKVTYKQLRTELLQKFLAEYERAIAEHDSEKVVKSNR